MTTTEYSKANVIAVSTLPDYKLLDKKVIYIDAKESAIHVFSARPATDAPIRRYYQAGADRRQSRIHLHRFVPTQRDRCRSRRGGVHPAEHHVRGSGDEGTGEEITYSAPDIVSGWFISAEAIRKSPG